MTNSDCTEPEAPDGLNKMQCRELDLEAMSVTPVQKVESGGSGVQSSCATQLISSRLPWATGSFGKKKKAKNKTCRKFFSKMKFSG